MGNGEMVNGEMGNGEVACHRRWWCIYRRHAGL